MCEFCGGIPRVYDGETGVWFVVCFDLIQEEDDTELFGVGDFLIWKDEHLTVTQLGLETNSAWVEHSPYLELLVTYDTNTHEITEVLTSVGEW